MKQSTLEQSYEHQQRSYDKRNSVLNLRDPSKQSMIRLSQGLFERPRKRQLLPKISLKVISKKNRSKIEN